MKKDIRASVALAVYNGQKYLPEQLDSILAMLGANDEIVISYDQSLDSTLKIITEYSRNDQRIICVPNIQKKGVSGNFTNAVMNCSGKYIFLSDQDDVWIGNKIEIMIQELQTSQADLAIHDGYLTDSVLNKYSQTLFEINKVTINPISNFIKGRFLGCCMAFKQEITQYILPFPDITDHIPHDIFTTIMVGMKGKICLVNDILILHRLHENNVSPRKRNKFYIIIKNRTILLWCILKRLLREKRRLS